MRDKSNICVTVLSTIVGSVQALTVYLTRLSLSKVNQTVTCLGYQSRANCRIQSKVTILYTPDVAYTLSLSLTQIIQQLKATYVRSLVSF